MPAGRDSVEEVGFALVLELVEPILPLFRDAAGVLACFERLQGGFGAEQRVEVVELVLVRVKTMEGAGDLNA
uniref:Uncharacterized protein n=1 Tax=mine drainage metagenome TaxID=410659 RepID=E6QKK4_9ZZZZ